MRRANQNVGIFREGDNVALSFGFDFCAEHEWGMDALNRRFGISNDQGDTTLGRYAVTHVPDGDLHLLEADVETTDWTASRRKKAKHRRLFLLGGDEKPYNQTLEQFVTGMRDSYPQADKPEAHWDAGAFLFSAPLGDDAAVVRAVHAAIIMRDALMYRSASGPFGGAGLIIARRSTIPPKIVAKMEGDLQDAKRLREAGETTGIRERVETWGRGLQSPRRVGCAFYALSPRWKPKDRASAHPVVFWLNPYDQENNNHGWFTVEELEQWMEGKGPIPKRAKRSA